ncbi:lauroyl acyltransferase lipid A biosynthesis [Candidatus Photodesmus blepharus]|uniref:Lipid A biosynthesis acyltransferase n=1 Tax=Candidatus Photodesmus blepharonis TaxID=1179155 RepID=A0A084CNC8_9GAMM|nr:lauroyl-Kdo(2)-lipid IV(A) myristoyltransferase [Candidatus Photodesmus blepharus]KEY91307.1 lauroyl acyltransferase lipid A biosynthesis [Candidatus Photodesmus blepharus]
MNNNTNNIDKYLYTQSFKYSFLHPKHWITWIAVFFAIILAFTPSKLRDKLARKLSTIIIKKNSNVVRRSRINLECCFPEKSDRERQQILQETFVKATQYLLGYSEFLIRSTKHNQRRGVIIGEENLLPLLDSGKNVIVFAPHTWSVDYPAMMLAAKGYRIATIMKPQRNPICNWLMHLQRIQYGGRIFARDAGVKPFVRSIKDGYLGYWLPDEDFGLNNSVFVPFFATEKATLRSFGKMTRLSKAQVVPILSTYDDKSSRYEVRILPAIANFPTDHEEQDARTMNTIIENLIHSHPEHYMWNLSLLKTRRDGKKIYNDS